MEDKFYPIPNLKPYVITKSGVVKNNDTGKLLTCIIRPRGYRAYVLYPNGLGRRQYSRHRLLMYTFKPNPNADNLQVDHVNGIPGDDRLENLEWVTGKENIHRYYKNHYEKRKLIKKPRIVVRHFDFKDRSKSRTKVYKDITETAQALGITNNEVRDRLYRKFGALFKDNTMIKTEDNKTPFPKVINPISYRLMRSLANGCIAYNHLTGETKEFPNETTCAKFLGVSISSLTSKMNYYSNKIFKSGWEVKRIGEPLIWSKPSKDTLDRIKFGLITSRPVEAIKGNERLVFKSTKECADHFGYTLGGFNWCLKANCDKPNKVNGWMFRYIKQK